MTEAVRGDVFRRFWLSTLARRSQDYHQKSIWPHQYLIAEEPETLHILWWLRKILKMIRYRSRSQHRPLFTLISKFLDTSFLIAALLMTKSIDEIADTFAFVLRKPLGQAYIIFFVCLFLMRTTHRKHVKHVPTNMTSPAHSCTPR